MAKATVLVFVRMILFLLLTGLLSRSSIAIDVRLLRKMAAQNNVTSILVFGDSSVDPGNNNRLATTSKSNYPPYGISFEHGSPTGRFSNGRLATDFIAEKLGYGNKIRAFLDPNLKKEYLLHGVSFASASSGYDDLTAHLRNVLTFSEQLKYFLHYKIHLRQLVGEEAAKEIVRNAIYLISMGTNDFLQNYFVEPTRPEEFNITQYQDFLISRMLRNFKALHKLGATRLAVVGIPPMGCMPLVETIKNEAKCVDALNQVAESFNTKIQEKLVTLRASLGIKTAYVDIYHTILNTVNHPEKYGITETSKGCCGTGTIEYGNTCKGMSSCKDPSKYVFWDAVHPTEKMYQIIADEALSSLNGKLLV